MEKHIFSRAFFGFCCGVTIGTLVCLLINTLIGGGSYMATVPVLLSLCGNECLAVFLGTLWTGMIGVAFAEASLVFEIAKWGALRQHIVHFLITGVVYLPFLLITNWFGNWYTLLGILGNIILTYGISWGIQCYVNKKEIEKINAVLARREHGRN